MYRRGLFATMLFTMVFGLFGSDIARAATRLDAETIKAGLETVDQEEDGFVERVVALVDKGILPRKTVATAFVWAKRKASRKFQYFRWAVIELAARQGVKVS